MLKGKVKEAVLDTHAESTVRSYSYAFEQWKDWCKQYGFCHLPATSVGVSLYLAEVMEKSDSHHPVTKALAAIQWFHEKALLPSPANGMVRQVAAAARRKLACNPERKKPFTKEEVKSMLQVLTESKSAFDLRTAVMISLGFSGFLRWDDMEQIAVGDIKFHDDRMEILLKKRKNDQMRKGSCISVARQSHSLCPVRLTEQLISTVILGNDDMLFSNIVQKKCGWRTKKGCTEVYQSP